MKHVNFGLDLYKESETQKNFKFGIRARLSPSLPIKIHEIVLFQMNVPTQVHIEISHLEDM